MPLSNNKKCLDLGNFVKQITMISGIVTKVSLDSEYANTENFCTESFCALSLKFNVLRLIV